MTALMPVKMFETVFASFRTVVGSETIRYDGSVGRGGKVENG